MSGNDILLSAAHQRISALENKTREMVEAIVAQQKMIEAQQNQLSAAQNVFDLMVEGSAMHSQMCSMLAYIVGYLGIALTSAKALPPEWAIAVRDASHLRIKPDDSEPVKNLVKILVV